jgi:hypothetical protein
MKPNRGSSKSCHWRDWKTPPRSPSFDRTQIGELIELFTKNDLQISPLWKRVSDGEFLIQTVFKMNFKMQVDSRAVVPLPRTAALVGPLIPEILTFQKVKPIVQCKP